MKFFRSKNEQLRVTIFESTGRVSVEWGLMRLTTIKEITQVYKYKRKLKQEIIVFEKKGNVYERDNG